VISKNEYTQNVQDFVHFQRLHGQIFAPAISAFTTSMWIMQEEEQGAIAEV
jgi:hypothetical protein